MPHPKTQGRPAPPHLAHPNACAGHPPLSCWGPMASHQAPIPDEEGECPHSTGGSQRKGRIQGPTAGTWGSAPGLWPSAWDLSPLRGSLCLPQSQMTVDGQMGGAVPGSLLGTGLGSPCPPGIVVGAGLRPCCLTAPCLASRISTSFSCWWFRGQLGCCCFRWWVQIFQPGMLLPSGQWTCKRPTTGASEASASITGVPAATAPPGQSPGMEPGCVLPLRGLALRSHDKGCGHGTLLLVVECSQEQQSSLHTDPETPAQGVPKPWVQRSPTRHSLCRDRQARAAAICRS